MAVFKVLGYNSSLFFSIFTKCWSVNLRTISKNRIIAELLEYPEKPRKPANPFIRFAISFRPDYGAQNLIAKTAEIMKGLGNVWNKMPQNEKEKYFKEYEQEMKEYKEKLEAYRNSLTSEQKEKLKKLRMEIKKSKAQVSFYSKCEMKSLNRPTSPASTFLRFCQESGYKGGISSKENIKYLAAKWKTLSESEIQKYKCEYEKEMEKYKKNLEKWELKMIQEGNMDVIRLKTLKELKRRS